MPTPKLVTPEQQLRKRLAGVLRRHRRLAATVGMQLDYDLDALAYLVQTSDVCEYCRLPYALSDLHLDHRTPLARGGLHKLSNLAAICSRCNLLKGALLEGEYRSLRCYLRTMTHPAAAEDLQRRLISGSAVYAKGRQQRRYR